MIKCYFGQEIADWINQASQAFYVHSLIMILVLIPDKYIVNAYPNISEKLPGWE